MKKVHNTGEKEDLPRSMRPVIPEPRHRVAPKGISSGISFRNLPVPSLNTIRKICEHYESKCSGQYDSLASRYVIQMGEEIRSQIEAMQHETVNKPQHFTLNDSIFDDLDFISFPNNEKEETATTTFAKSNHRRSTIPQHESNNPIRNSNNPIRNSSSSKSSNERALERQIKKLEGLLSKKKSELKVQKEKATKDLKECKQQYLEQNQIDRLHYENSQRLLKQAHNDEIKKLKNEITQVKSDARLIIDFVRRKANEAIVEESTKVEHQKRSIGKKMEAIESKMKKSFHNHLHSLEKEVKMVVRKEKKAINLTVLPPPPPKNISIMPKRKLNQCFFPMQKKKDENRSIPTGEMESSDCCSNDSILTCFSASCNIISGEEEKETCISNEHELLRKRVKELEQWTDTLTLALRSGAKISNKDKSDCQKPNLRTPPPSPSSCNLDM